MSIVVTPIDWLLKGEPWVEYKTRLDIIGQTKTDTEVIEARKKMLSHPRIQSMISEFDDWDSEIVSNHKNAGLLLHKLAFLADIGLTAGDPETKKLANIITEHKTKEGIIQVPINIPIHFGGAGENTWGWCLCDAPIILYSLIKFGFDDDTPCINSALQFLKSFIKDYGWGCTVSPELGKFRGPGRKDDPCPYAILLMLKLYAQVPEYSNSEDCRIGAESLLKLWTESMERHPYMFYMGTDFRKLKAPLVWYDIVHVTDVLSQFDWLRKDPRLIEMVSLIKSQVDENGYFTPQSEWKAWTGWDFGQKKKPSPLLTCVILSILKKFDYLGKA
jgi:hypothetical protein